MKNNVKRLNCFRHLSLSLSLYFLIGKKSKKVVSRSRENLVKYNKNCCLKRELPQMYKKNIAT